MVLFEQTSVLVDITGARSRHIHLYSPDLVPDPRTTTAPDGGVIRERPSTEESRRLKSENRAKCRSIFQTLEMT